MPAAYVIGRLVQMKKEDEEAELTKAYEQFRETFEEGGTVAGGKSFVRGAVVNANRVVQDYTMPAAYVIGRLVQMKKEDEEAELTKAYEQFRETFEEGGTVAGGKSFVRGAVVNANRVVQESNGDNPLYKPKVELTKKPLMGSSFEQAKKLAEEKARKMMEEARKTNPVITQRPPRPGRTQQKSRTSNLEAFKEELKNLQEQRQQRRTLRSQMEQMGVEKEALDRIAPLIDNPYLHGSGEYDNDPNTTNIYLSNLALEIKVEDLYDTFGTFGPLASAKILYPRDDDRKRERLCGFVAFMSRKDTDRAMAAMQGKMIKGCPLRLSLAKPVNIPPQPIYVPPALMELAMPDPPTGLPFNAKPRKEDLDALLEKCPLPRLGGILPEPGRGREEYDKMIRNAVVRVVVPTERSLLLVIHRVIEFIVREGPLFEAMLMSRERQNPVYRFLFDNHHPAHVYYRWKLYSILQGDSPHSWRMKRFRLFDEGSWWEPPPPNVVGEMPECLYHTAYTGPEGPAKETEKSRKRRYSSSEDEDDDRKAEVKAKWRGVLSTSERDELEDILRELVPEKTSVADAMVWCADHASCAKEISQCLLESLALSETPLHKKIARLYLIADILANCAARVRDVFYYRQYIGDLMPDIFKELNKTYEAIEGRLKAEQFKQRVMLCFRTWEDNSLYPTDFLIQLQNIFLGLAPKEEIPSEEDIDGAPIDDELEGKGLKKESIFDDDEEDIDGAPIEEEPTNQSPPKKKTAAFKTSHWSTVDPSVVAAQAVTTSKWELIENGKDDESPSPSPRRVEKEEEEDVDGEPMEGTNQGSEDGECPDDDDDDDKVDSRDSSAFASRSSSSSRLDEQRRKILREIEVKVVKLQDELEAEKCDDVATQVQNYRASLLKRMEEKLDALGGGAKGKKKKDKQRKRSRSRKRDEKKEEKVSRERDRERSRGGDSERRSRDRDRGRDTPRAKERERGREKGRDRDRSRSRSGSKSRERHSRRDRSSERRRR
ncbi:U2 snRNP-associated SURP motif-containing protein [Toxocara canis]|uniref:U2 snRNP-associated SURP motif-containing protein n=1 Tax=Toxocara canis TaxID=6265 RepID=A0A0B2W110_TOXCA|nr:U2 snRNP-associated SURP motif-containing protein [Toxocara canis]